MKLFVILILAVFASENKENAVNGPKNEEKIGSNSIAVKIEEEDYAKVNKTSKFIGVFYDKNNSKWRTQRWRKYDNKMLSNGCYHNEKTAAHASDTLARKVMENVEQKLKLNFPDDHIEVCAEEKSSKFIGVSYYGKNSKWYVSRWSKNEKKYVSNGYYNDEETAAHASDTLARKLMKNGEQNHKLNFPDDHIEVYRAKAPTSKFIGVTYNKNMSNWRAQRWNKYENKNVSYGYYEDEETAVQASDTLARQIMENGEHKLKLNFPDDHTEIHSEENQMKKRKRQKE